MAGERRYVIEVLCKFLIIMKFLRDQKSPIDLSG